MPSWTVDWHHQQVAIRLVVAALVAAVVLCLRRVKPREGHEPETPEAVVKRRYAGGEIDRRTYERMLEELRR